MLESSTKGWVPCPPPLRAHRGSFSVSLRLICNPESCGRLVSELRFRASPSRFFLSCLSTPVRSSPAKNSNFGYGAKTRPSILSTPSALPSTKSARPSATPLIILALLKPWLAEAIVLLPQSLFRKVLHRPSAQRRKPPKIYLQRLTIQPAHQPRFRPQ